MRKILVLKHAAQESLGQIKPLVAERGIRVRYLNFSRDPEAKADVEKYQGLILLGGWMGVYEAERYPHILRECKIIERALEKQIPVLGICLGAQILAHALGAKVERHHRKECGWSRVQVTAEGAKDRMLRHFSEQETVFQMHGDTYELPNGAVHLALSSQCEQQAFRYGSSAYGLQFHLEMDDSMFAYLLNEGRKDLSEFAGESLVDSLMQENQKYLSRSKELAQKVFSEFLDLLPLPERKSLTRSAHGKGSIR